MEQKGKKGLWKAAALAFAAALLIKLFLCDLMVTQGRSMLPTLHPGSVLVVNRAAYGFRIPLADMYLFRWASPRPGDLVVFYTPLGERAVKRCSSVDEEGAFFALGDNGLESFDSRSYGFIQADCLLGKVVAHR